MIKGKPPFVPINNNREYNAITTRHISATEYIGYYLTEHISIET